MLGVLESKALRTRMFWSFTGPGRLGQEIVDFRAEMSGGLGGACVYVRVCVYVCCLLEEGQGVSLACLCCMGS